MHTHHAAVRSARRAVIMLGCLSIVGWLTVASGNAASSLTWTHDTAAGGPSARAWVTLAYDPATFQLVEFGGYAATHNYQDTWTFNGQKWTQAATTGPDARNAYNMTYDAATNQFLLFGGYSDVGNGTLFNDTWQWNGTAWQQLQPAHMPSGRCCAAMAYDAATHQLLMFGGQINNSDATSNDTWVWTGTDWAQLTPTTLPHTRDDAVMSYDATSGQLILFGGWEDGHDGNDTWAWTGSNWQQLAPANSPQPREGAGMAYSPGLGGLVLYGGYDWNAYSNGSSFSPMNDTWLWKNGTWTQLPTAGSPPTRGYVGLGYDPVGQQLVMFGGSASETGPDLDNANEASDTWTMATPVASVSLSPAQLARASLHKAYHATVSAHGGTAPYHFAVTHGSLPSGLSMSSSGAITGTPKRAGTDSVTVTATDAHGATGTHSYTITVKPRTTLSGPHHAAKHKTFTLHGTGQPKTRVTLYAASHNSGGGQTTTSNKRGKFHFHVSISSKTTFYAKCDGAKSKKLTVKVA